MGRAATVTLELDSEAASIVEKATAVVSGLVDAPIVLALSLQDAAAATGYSVATIRRAIDRGELKRRYATSTPVVVVSELTEWLLSLPEDPPAVNRRK